MKDPKSSVGKLLTNPSVRFEYETSAASGYKWKNLTVARADGGQKIVPCL